MISGSGPLLSRAGTRGYRKIAPTLRVEEALSHLQAPYVCRMLAHVSTASSAVHLACRGKCSLSAAISGSARQSDQSDEGDALTACMQEMRMMMTTICFLICIKCSVAPWAVWCVLLGHARAAGSTGECAAASIRSWREGTGCCLRRAGLCLGGPYRG